MIIKKEDHKTMKCDNCEVEYQVVDALKKRWVYSQGGHYCEKCKPEELLS